MWQKHWEEVRAVTGVQYTWTQVQVNDAEWKEQRLYFILKTSCRTADVCNNARSTRRDVVMMAKGVRRLVTEMDESQLVVLSVSVSLDFFSFFFLPMGHQCQKMTRRPFNVHSLQSLTVIRAETSKPYSATHIIHRRSCNKRVPPVLNPHFLVFDLFYFYYYCSCKEKKTFTVELKILLDFSSGNRNRRAEHGPVQWAPKLKTNCL